MIPSLRHTARIFTKVTQPFGESILKLRREKEAQLAQKIKKGLSATYVSVTDTTIGTSSCTILFSLGGQMYNILVESPTFEGKSRVQQHQLVSEVLKEEIASIHGFNLKTKIPKKAEENK